MGFPVHCYEKFCFMSLIETAALYFINTGYRSFESLRHFTNTVKTCKAVFSVFLTFYTYFLEIRSVPIIGHRFVIEPIIAFVCSGTASFYTVCPCRKFAMVAVEHRIGYEICKISIQSPSCFYRFIINVHYFRFRNKNPLIICSFFLSGSKSGIECRSSCKSCGIAYENIIASGRTYLGIFAVGSTHV